MNRRVKLTQNARKRHIGKAHIVAAMEDAGDPQVIPASEEGRADRLLWIGRDDRGLLLEIIAVELPDYLLVIHVMPALYRSR